LNTREQATSDRQEPWNGNLVGELRWHAELAHLLFDPIWAGKGVPRGSGETVMVVPGVLSGDRSTLLLRQWLRRIGYEPHSAGMELNLDCSARALVNLERRVERLAESSGGQIALVGHSRGGILGRALATRRPDLVHVVVALGSGLDDGYDISLPLRLMIRVVRGYHGLTTDRVTRNGCMTQACACEFGDASRAPFPDSVELVSVFSRQDGFSNWRSSQVSYAHNVEVTGSHVGLVVNRTAYRAIGLALAGRAEEIPA
jgi:triacylglycerol lipase